MPFSALGDILNKKYGSSLLAKQVTAALVCEEFDRLLVRVFGAQMENLGKAMYLKDKVLTIACLSPVVAGEIKMREKILIEKINEVFGGEHVVGLRLLM
jgi:hypothetical protein